MTKFIVKGRFIVDRHYPAVNADPAANPPVLPQDERREDTPAAYADRNALMLAPNWWELLIKSFKIYYDNHELKTSNEPPAVMPFLNAFLYAHMDQESKKHLVHSQAHPILGVDTVRDRYGTGLAGDKWREYARSVYTGNEFTFYWTPAHVFPFWQGTQFPQDMYASTVLPINYFKRPLDIQILFNKNPDIVCRRAAGTQHRLKFELTDFKLLVEEAIMNPLSEKALCTRGRVFQYQGLTKQMTAENVTGGVMTHKVRFANIDFPEGIFIFAVNKKVVGGTWSFNDLTDGVVGLFSDHNIREVEVSFGGKEMYHKEPHNGQLHRDVINLKHLLDYRQAPPFGMKLDPELLTLDQVALGCSATAYPNVYINLKNTKDGERTAPIHEDGSITATKRDLEVVLKFGATGATENTTYMIYTWYTDTNMELHLLPDRDALFVNPYLQKM
jgi:hypothetical protein